ncbi:hypothetical protein ACFQ0Q_47555 [Streptomyces aureus]
MLRALASLAALATAIVGLPLLLIKATPVVWATSHDDLAHLIDRQDTGGAFLLLLIAVAWIGWATFAFCTLREIPLNCAAVLGTPRAGSAPPSAWPPYSWAASWSCCPPERPWPHPRPPPRPQPPPTCPHRRRTRPNRRRRHTPPRLTRLTTPRRSTRSARSGPPRACGASPSGNSVTANAGATSPP